MTLSFFPLLAAGWGMEEILRIVVLLVFGLIYLINHFVGAAGKAQRKPGRPNPPAPRPGGRQEMQDEVAEFLKRATEKRTAPKPVEQRPPQPRRPAPIEIVEAHAVEELPSSRWPQTVQPHVDNRDLAQRAAHLTHVDQSEAAFQAHMQVFDHTLGRINDTAAPAAPSEAVSQAALPANEIFAALLADPQSLRQAIVLNEIMVRPTERW